MLQVIDNFIERSKWNQFRNILTSSDINWFYQKHMVQTGKNPDNFYFAHIFFHKNTINSPFYDPFIVECLERLKVAATISVRANMYLRTGERYYSNWHTDNKLKGATTAVLYVNSNDGGTEFKDTNEFVQSEENRIVIFPSETQHRVKTQLSTPNRIVINFNYF
tara:strand:+ start:467 stop:958 length:492 start_codon:yes stop_codon:yes gene_type:complete